MRQHSLWSRSRSRVSVLPAPRVRDQAEGARSSILPGPFGVRLRKLPLWGRRGGRRRFGFDVGRVGSRGSFGLWDLAGLVAGFLVSVCRGKAEAPLSLRFRSPKEASLRGQPPRQLPDLGATAHWRVRQSLQVPSKWISNRSIDALPNSDLCRSMRYSEWLRWTSKIRPHRRQTKWWWSSTVGSY